MINERFLRNQIAALAPEYAVHINPVPAVPGHWNLRVSGYFYPGLSTREVSVFLQGLRTALLIRRDERLLAEVSNG